MLQKDIKNPFIRFCNLSLRLLEIPWMASISCKKLLTQASTSILLSLFFSWNIRSCRSSRGILRARSKALATLLVSYGLAWKSEQVLFNITATKGLYFWRRTDNRQSIRTSSHIVHDYKSEQFWHNLRWFGRNRLRNKFTALMISIMSIDNEPIH